MVFRKIYDMKKYQKILFNILLYCDKYLGPDIKFENQDIYKEFVSYSISEGKYLRTLNYLNHNIIQLNLLKEHIDKIFESENKIRYEKLEGDSYKDAQQLVEDLIKYQNGKGTKFITFPKTFWENYYNYYMLNPGIENKIDKLDKLYELLKLYGEIEPDDSEYKEILSENIHKIIETEIKEESITIKEQLEYLFKKDPYYIYEDYKKKRNPEIFKEIKIFDLSKKEDVEYFKNIDLEKIYGKFFAFIEEKKEEKDEEENKEEGKKYFLDIIVERIETIEHFIFILDLIKIKLKEDEKNKNAYAYIELIIKRYLEFEDLELTEESLLILLERVIEYSPNKIIELLERALPKFNQNYKIYLKLYEKYEEDGDIQKQLAISSLANLDLNNFIEFIKGLGNEEKKFNYLKILENKILSAEKISLIKKIQIIYYY